MNRQTMVTGLRNVVLLVLIAMPLFFMLVWFQALLQGTAGGKDLRYVLETGGVYYLNNVLPVLAGGLLHQAAWFALPQGWPVGRRRLIAFILALIIPLGVVVAWGGPASSLMDFAVPIVLSTALYVLLMKPPGG